MVELVLLIVNSLFLVVVAWLLLVRGSAGGELDITKDLKDNRQELAANLKHSTDSINKQLGSGSKLQQQALEQLGERLEKRLRFLQTDNNKHLEKMRQTVDEKLQSTLEKRIGQSFKQVEEQLETVYKGLGEMKVLASDVGSLQKVMSNIKTRGAWGEAQLGSLLEEVLNPEQYVTDAVTKPGSNDHVEFAIKIPSKDRQMLLLPIDSKFPLTSYEQLMDASAKGDKTKVLAAQKSLANEIKTQAKRISDKYISPPATTDFAIMYLPIEGLYAEVAQQAGLVDEVRQKHKIALAGPSTILPALNFVQMGYRTLAIQERTSEVWQLLTITREEFGKFGDLLDKAQKKLTEASNVIESAGSKSRNIETKLNKVQRIGKP